MSQGCAVGTPAGPVVRCWQVRTPRPTDRDDRFRAAAMGLLLSLLATASSQTTQPIDAPPRHRTVLVLQSYYPTFTWTDQITSGIASVFAGQAPDVDLYFEFMDAKRHPEEAYLHHLHTMYRHKYQDEQIDAVICCDDHALEFLLHRGADLLPGVPAVFCGINGFEPTMRQRGRPLTGVAEVLEPKTTLDIALQLHPNTQRVVVICDRTLTGQAIEAAARADYQEYTSRLAFTYLNDVTMPELLDRVAQLTDGTLVLLLVFNRDNAGQDYKHEYSLQLIAQHCRVPIYGFWAFYLGHGIVGGKLVAGRTQGATAADLTLRVLAGEDAGTIPIVTTAPNRYMFDDAQLRRFGLRTSQLPAGSLVINETRSFYAENKALLWRVAAIIGGLSVLVIVLAINVVQRLRAQARLRAALQASMDGLCVLDRQGAILDVNSACCQLLGYTRDELLRMHVRDIEAVESSPAVQEHVARIVHTQADRFQTQHRRKDGTRIDVDVSATYLDWEGGRIFAFFRDVTDRRRSETALRESELMYRSLFETAGDAIFLLRMDGDNPQVVECNQRAEQLFGATRTQLRQVAMLDFSTPEQPDGTPSRAAAAAHIAQALQGETRYFEWRHRRLDGTTLDTEVTLTPVPLGSGQHLLAIVRDITQRKQIAAALLERERLLENIIEQNPYPIWISDAHGTLIRINRACCDLLNIGEEHVIGQYNVLQDNIVRAQGFLPLVQSVYDEGRTVHFTLDYDMAHWPHGRWGSIKHVILEVTIAPVKDEHGVLTNAVIMHHDITQRRRDEEERQQLEAQLRQAQKMEAVGQLAGGVAHDFNNILTAILGNVDLLQQALAPKLAPDDAQMIGLQQVERGALRAADLTRQLLLFSRRGVTQPEALNLNQTLNDAVKMLQRLLTENVRLELQLAPDLLPVWADSGQIEQVIVNLVVNARDAMPDGGRILIETSNETLDESYTAAHAEARPGPHVLLAVSDTGTGMSHATIERIFEPFFTTKPTGQGTGLGLATVYGIVKQADGHIMVYSEVGRGSTFKVYLPALTTPVPATTHPASPAEALAGGTETILICEDDDTVRQLVAHMLRDVGYTILTAAGGEDALRQSAQHNGTINLLITDVIMPDTNGKHLADTLLKKRPDLKILFISGYTANIIAHHGVLDDNVQFLPKPFSRRALLRRVREVLDGVRSSPPHP